MVVLVVVIVVVAVAIFRGKKNRYLQNGGVGRYAQRKRTETKPKVCRENKTKILIPT